MNATIKKLKKPDKTSIIKAIIKAYEHDYDAETGRISKRRLWYILKPQFTSANLTGIKSKGKQVLPISNANYNKAFNELADSGEIEDSYIYDNSRTSRLGTNLPHIIVVSEKATIEAQALNIAEKFGLSTYIAGGFSSIYGAKKLIDEIRGVSPEPITILMMSDYDKSGIDIQDTAGRHLGVSPSNIHRVLLEPHQVPSLKLGDYFAIDSKMGKLYELDVLNSKELVEVFIANLPSAISSLIKDTYEEKITAVITANKIEEEVNNHPDVVALEEQLLLLKQGLYKKYESTFIASDPITISPFTEQDIYDGSVKYTIDKWMD